MVAVLSVSGLIPAHAGSTVRPRHGREVRPAHPRSRGEHKKHCLTSCRLLGSSPLTRGARAGSVSAAAEGGLIPAHAGSTTAYPDEVGYAEAHPRSRGEHVFTYSVWRTWPGSSPLTRGARAGGHGPQPPHRLIPAHAGSTWLQPSGGLCRGAHPRSRGEHAHNAQAVIPNTGSSPLTRGAQHLLRNLLVQRGLIPAHAGSTRCWSGFRGRGWAHPRSRGEHAGGVIQDGVAKGSSPLTRGAPPGGIELRAEFRLIPAHAGSTTRSPSETSAKSAHPRSRGEHCEVHRQVPQVVGLIPAHAGSTVLHPPPPTTLRAHPRSRGEHVSALRSRALSLGSSPLTRGALRKEFVEVVTGGLIPAHAGSTQTLSRILSSAWAHPRSRGEHKVAVLR